MNNHLLHVSHIGLSLEGNELLKLNNCAAPFVKDSPPDCMEMFIFSPNERTIESRVFKTNAESYLCFIPAETFPSKFVHNEASRKLAWLLASGSVSVCFYIPGKTSIMSSPDPDKKLKLFEYVYRLFRLIRSAVCEKNGDRQLDVNESYLTLLSYALFFTLTDAPITYKIIQNTDSDISSYVITAKLFVNDNLACATLNSAAEYAGISSEYLSRLFKEQCRTKFSSYLRETRMLSAKKHFSSGEKSENEVAEKIGYSNIRSFRQCFRDRFGLTPLEFIKETETNARTERI
jgi:AraC-like DNA-binding protein